MKRELRIPALRRFAVAITLLNVLGHTFLGFEASVIQSLVALLTAYGVELLLATAHARARGQAPPFARNVSALLNTLTPAHITGLAVGMLLHVGDRLLPLVFASTTAIASKALFRTRDGSSHVLNPSNAGIAATLLLFPSVGIAPPYQFTAGLDRAGDLLAPLVITGLGIHLNLRYTGRGWLIFSWFVGFVSFALLRACLGAATWQASVAPATGLAFILFSLYMVSDPGTTPSGARGQVAFGLATAAVYATLQALHIVFGLFFSLLIVSFVRWLAGHLPLPRAAS